MLRVLTNANVFDYQIPVIPVNTVGVMGKGLAKTFAQSYPDLTNQYKIRCSNNSFNIGDLLLLESDWGKKFLLYPTKRHWRDPSRIDYVKDGFTPLASLLISSGVPEGTEIAFPKLGCGLGGLDWGVVKPLMLDGLEPLSQLYTVYICE